MNHRGLDLGFIYQSNAIYNDNSPISELNPDIYNPSSVPGGSAPHYEIKINNKICSILDLFIDKYVLLVSSNCDSDMIRSKLPIPKKYPLVCYQLNKDFTDVNHDFNTLYQMSNYKAVLVRPDGHIAWRD